MQLIVCFFFNCGGDYSVLISNGSEHISLVYFCRPCLPANSLIPWCFPCTVNSLWPGTRASFLRLPPVCAAIASRHAHNYHKLRTPQNFLFRGKSRPNIFLCNRFQVLFFSNSSHLVEPGMNQLPTARTASETYSIFFSHLVPTPPHLRSTKWHRH